MRFINLNSVPPALVFVTVMLVFVLSTNGVWAHPEEGLGEHVVEACRLDGIPPPKIDGQLDDEAWQCAKPVNGFIQLVPDRGQPATDDTEFYIAYDRHHLYVAFRGAALRTSRKLYNPVRILVCIQNIRIRF